MSSNRFKLPNPGVIRGRKIKLRVSNQLLLGDCSNLVKKSHYELCIRDRRTKDDSLMIARLELIILLILITYLSLRSETEV